MTEEIKLESRRERHKDRRRGQIIEAAYDLLREVGADDLSVKMIADRADVSAATIYNLFGSKGAVLERVYERDFEAFAEKMADAGADSALDEMFKSIHVVADLYRSDPSFYRGMSIRNPRAEPELVVSVQGPRVAYWWRLIRRAVRERDLAADTRVDLVGVSILQLGSGVFSAWAAGLITTDDLELQTTYGIARLLLSVARPAGRPKLLAQIAAVETALSPSSAERSSDAATA